MKALQRFLDGFIMCCILILASLITLVTQTPINNLKLTNMAEIENLNLCVTIKEIKNNIPLWYKIHVFVYDLRNFHVSQAQARLDEAIDASYIGSPCTCYMP